MPPRTHTLLPLLAVLLLAGCTNRNLQTTAEVERLSGQHDFQAAQDLLRQALKQDPKNPVLLRSQTRLFLRMEQLPFAIAAYRKLEQVHPADPILRDALRDPDPVIRVQAAKAIGLMHAPDAIPSLQQALRDENQSVRQAAVLALGELKDPGSVPALLQALDDPDWYVRAEAATTLGKIGDGTAAGGLLARLADPDAYVRENSRRALFELATAENQPAFLKALENGDPAIRRMAAVALAHAGNAGGLEILTAALKEKGHSDTPEIIRALTRLHDPRAYPALRECARYPDPQIAAMAVLSLGRQGDVDSVPMLRQLAQSKQPLVKSAAQVALNEMARPR